MKYNQPFGITDPNAAYINGNPATGTMGSIPPAFSIEHDQREIVAVIQWAADHGYHDYANALCQNPSAADLTQLLKAIFGIMNSTRLLAPATYYVNNATGNDSFNGTTPGTAFKTLQKAAYAASFFNLNGFDVFIYVADGTYGPVKLGQVNGSGYIRFIGNQANPVNCKIHANIGAAVRVMGANYQMFGFRYESDAPDPVTTGEPGSGIFCHSPGTLAVGDCEFGYCATSHIECYAGGNVGYYSSVRIVGNSAACLSCGAGTIGPSGIPWPSIVIPNAVTINTFLSCGLAGALQWGYTSITGLANVSGVKYAATGNGVIDSEGRGAGGTPGTGAGSVATGGQFL